MESQVFWSNLGLLWRIMCIRSVCNLSRVLFCLFVYVYFSVVQRRRRHRRNRCFCMQQTFLLSWIFLILCRITTYATSLETTVGAADKSRWRFLRHSVNIGGSYTVFTRKPIRDVSSVMEMTVSWLTMGTSLAADETRRVAGGGGAAAAAAEGPCSEAIAVAVLSAHPPSRTAIANWQSATACYQSHAAVHQCLIQIDTAQRQY